MTGGAQTLCWKCRLGEFLYQREKNLQGILQKFIYPKNEKNCKPFPEPMISNGKALGFTENKKRSIFCPHNLLRLQ